ncbi:CBS domain containing-hemolysin-like protein [Longispora fulva]|uniref:CBS domain containing-hemolysin-like protein n=1 Tax=Longispora fulva TaxID=619741 RepID=A0A8J7KIS0_9ACTN|nr:CBS domain containing-hemolysin-like protein [Longispora fulva]
MTVDRGLIEQQAAAGDRKSKTVQKALRNLSFQLSGAQLGITITALLSGYLAKPAIAHLIHPVISNDGVATGVALGIATLFSMLFGELVPKNAALAKPMPIARATAAGQRQFSRVFGWLIRILNGSANFLVRRLGIEPQEELASARSPEELGLLVAMSAKAGAMDSETAALLRRTIRFGDKRAAEAMTPRVDVVALAADATVADMINRVRETGRSRFPVYVDTLDQVVGVATIADALAIDPAHRAFVRVRNVAREPVFVPESLDLDAVLDELRRGDSDLAIVVDEYGGTDGVVTIEDLVEELVGEIVDEHDRRELAAPVVSETVSGVLREDEVQEQTGFTLPDGPYETLAGFLLAQLGHLPQVGERVEYEGWEFTVTEMDKHRIEQVKVHPPASEDEDGEEA